MTPAARCSHLAITLFLGLAEPGCDRSDEPTSAEASSSSSTGSSTSSGAATSSDESHGSTNADASTGVDWDCDPVVPGGYLSCPENNPAACGATGTCLEAFAVEGGRVCTIIGCVDRCDCFAPPDSGTATVECMEGIVADNAACVLYCGNGEQCPDGMECSVQSCVWPPG